VHALKENLAVKDIAVCFQDGKNIAALLDSHLKEYGGLYMYDETYLPMTAEKLRERVEAYARNENLKAEIAAHEASFKINAEKFSQLLKSKEYSEVDLLYLQFAHEYAEFMELRNTYRGYSAFHSRALYDQVGKRLGLALDETLSFSDYEMVELLVEPNNHIKDEAALRLKHAVFTYDRGHWQRVDEERARELERRVRSQDTTEIKGISAFKASPVRGEVRIINAVADMHKLNAGDVLVSSMTRPEFIMSIERAAAIVTDEGGTLCHAAIVSREMKKPCVIGTKIATQVLKDGDLVEVDAEKGIVRKL